MGKRQVKTTREHIQKLSKASPVDALEELIWNGLDAGGPMVEVRFALNSLKSLQTIEVVDSGKGIPVVDLDAAFGEIGNSRKPVQKVNDDGRRLIGSEGRGRLKALSLCHFPQWITTYRQNGSLRRYTISISADDPECYDPSDEEILSSGKLGTVVRLDNVEDGCDALLRPTARERLTQRFALYLSEYPETQITFDGELLRVDDCIEQTQKYPLDLGDDDPDASVTVIEWKFKVDSRKLYFCNATGFAHHDVPLKLHAPGLMYTAYIRSKKVQDWADANLLVVSEMDPSIQQVVDRAKDVVRGHIRERLSLEAADVVAEWKEQDVYPYKEGENSNPVVAAEQQVFDVVAVQVHSLHPTFRQSDLDNKRLTLTLIRKALESNPSTLISLLQSFLDLPEDEKRQLETLLSRTTLSSIIKAASVVAERLDTVKAFGHILFDEPWKERLLERTQLHRLLAHELWLLGEEFDIATDDEGLRTVLLKHAAILGRTDLAPNVDVKLIDGKDGIPDLMLWHRGKVDRELFEHLVLELKRPRDFLGEEEITQTRKYAFAVATDERFNTSKVRWKFVLLGNDLDAYATSEASQDHLPSGCVYKKGNVSVWVLRWADVLADAEARYEFFREKLNVQASSAEGMANWKDKFGHLFEGRGARKKKDQTATAKRSSAKSNGTPTKISPPSQPEDSIGGLDEQHLVSQPVPPSSTPMQS